MKKILTTLLILSLVAALFSAFALGASAEETELEVTVGQKFEWNYQGETTEQVKAWGTSKGVSPDGLWKYQFYALGRKVYGDVVYSAEAGGFAWSKTPGNDGLGYARVRDHGRNFHPGQTADIAKVFTFPSGGTVAVDTTIARVSEWVSGKNTATSFAVYLEDQLVYPTSGEYVSIVSTVETPINFEIEVQKNQRLYFRIGGIDGDISSDAVLMSNTITYKSVNDNSVDAASDDTLNFTVPTNTMEDLTLTDKDDNAGPANPGSNPSGGEESSSMGLIIGIVAAVAVVAVVVVVVIKKKQQ